MRDRTRADRLRQIYLQIAALEYEFDLARARAVEQPVSMAADQLAAAAPGEGVHAQELERFLLPPLEDSQAIFERFRVQLGACFYFEAL